MLIPVSDLRSYWRVKPAGVVHVGAHKAEELVAYEENSFGPVIWIEAQANLVSEISKMITPPSEVIHALVWNKDNEVLTLNLANNGQSSSVFEFGSHQQSYPEIEMSAEVEMKTSRLDSLLPDQFQHSFLNLDIQGAEYQALEGLGSKLGNFDYVYTEVNREQVYKGIHQVRELDLYLESHQFLRVATVWTRASWGDALYINRRRVLEDFGSVGLTKARSLIFGVLVVLKHSISKLPIRSWLGRLSREFNSNKVQ